MTHFWWVLGPSLGLHIDFTRTYQRALATVINCILITGICIDNFWPDPHMLKKIRENDLLEAVDLNE
jgi:hypothetical protein